MMQLNDLFASLLESEGIAYEREYKAIPGRRYSYDFYIPEGNLLIELQGGIYMKQGGHNTPSGIQRDYEKVNLATLNGYAIMQFTTQLVEDGIAIKQIKTIFGGK